MFNFGQLVVRLFLLNLDYVNKRSIVMLFTHTPGPSQTFFPFFSFIR